MAGQYRDHYGAVRLLLVFPLNFLGLVALGAALSGCSTLSYILHVSGGQLAISNRAKPLTQVIEDERTPPKLQKLLKQVPDIKKYGETNGLKKTHNYEQFVKLDRSYANWVISACKPLEFKSKTWSFPIVGSFTYLGWFDKELAEEYGQELKEEGWDVDQRGAGAFSTLGWFRDPIFSSMIRKGDRAIGALVNVILHESVHATIYIYGQSYFNESIASYVADRMTYEYLEKNYGLKSNEYKVYKKGDGAYDKRQKLYARAYKKLEQLYQSSSSVPEKLRQKKRVLDQLTKDAQLSGGRTEINNATLIQYKTYGEGTQDFDGLYLKCGRNWSRFISRIHTLREKDFPKEHLKDLNQVIKPLEKKGC